MARFDELPGNLNRLEIGTAAGRPVSFADPTATSSDGSTVVYFRDLAARLIEHIGGADIVIGCVAWLTHGEILGALATKKGTALIVQKEDFLRPDIDTKNRGSFKRRLRGQYGALPEGPSRYAYQGTFVPDLSFAGDPSLAPVRCVGGHNVTGRSAFPRAHHKFVLFCGFEEPESGEENGHAWFGPGAVYPYAVWTGSFNFSKNASHSLDNAVVLRDPAIVNAYYQEWAQVLAVSEPLDWTASWIAPDWRIGS